MAVEFALTWSSSCWRSSPRRTVTNTAPARAKTMTTMTTDATTSLPWRLFKGDTLLLREPVSGSPDCLDAHSGSFQLLPQPRHVHVNRPRRVEAGTPHQVQKLIAVKRHAREPGHRRQQVKLLRRQGKSPAASFRRPRRRIDQKTTGADDLAVHAGLAAAHSPEDGVHARQELVRVEWLGDVVVSAQPKTGDLVDVRRASR